MEAKTLAYALGLLAAVFWLVAAVAALWAASAKLDIGEPTESKTGSFRVSTDGVIINGMTVPDFQSVIAYQKALARRNFVAMICNGLGAVFAALAAYFSYVA